MEKLKKHLPLISAILAVVAFLMLFVPVILNVWDPEFGTHTFFGFESVFGTHKDFYGTTVHVLRYSFWNLLSYLLVVYVAVFGFVCRKKVNAKLGIFTGVCALAAGIIFFLVLQTTFFCKPRCNRRINRSWCNCSRRLFNSFLCCNSMGFNFKN